jgi:hypothetical protein
MIVTKDQIKLFVEGVFAKHSFGNHDTMSMGQLYEFFCNFLKNTK